MQQENNQQNVELAEIEKFCESVEEIASKGSSYMDSIISHCEAKGIELEMVKSLISPALQYKLKNEAEAIHMLKPPSSKRLPI
jgi:hypothetical protein